MVGRWDNKYNVDRTEELEALECHNKYLIFYFPIFQTHKNKMASIDPTLETLAPSKSGWLNLSHPRDMQTSNNDCANN
jgi:hypothetical protein